MAGAVVVAVVERLAGGGVGAALAEAAGVERVEHAVVATDEERLAAEALASEEAAVTGIAGLVVAAGGAVAADVLGVVEEVLRRSDHLAGT